MRILLVKKTTGFELYGHDVKEQVDLKLFPEKDFERLKLVHDEHYATLKLLEKGLSAAGIEVEEITRDPIQQNWPEETSFDAVITVGGDGTLLSASHFVHKDELLIGIRSSSSSIGHLCACGPEHVSELIKHMKSQKLKYVSAQRLAAEIVFVSNVETLKTAPILNDFLFANRHPAAMTRYRLRLGKIQEEIKSSGIWVATPAGSSAAIAAAGGQKLSLDSRDFQYAIRERYLLQGEASQLSAGKFDPDSDRFEIECRTKHAILALDGQHGLINLGYGDRVIFHRAKPINLAVSW